MAEVILNHPQDRVPHVQALAALESAQGALATTERMVEAVLAMFNSIELDAILSNVEHGDAYPLLCAAETCLNRAKNEATACLAVVDKAVRYQREEVSHG